MEKLTWKHAAAWRARRHFLDERARAGEALNVASRICGLHAQVLSSAELSLWARVEGLERGTVQRALWKDRVLVKTWAMRGTLHLLPASELPLWHSALGTSSRYRTDAFWQRCCGVSIEQLDRVTEAIDVALRGKTMTRVELAAEVARRTGTTLAIAQNGWGMILKPAAFAGHLCFAPGVGQLVRFTHPATWVDCSKQVAEDQALMTIARRYLAAYGPSTANDLARWWGGGGIADTRKWIATLADEVREVDVEGTKSWMLAKDVAGLREVSPQRAVRLLPAFDPYVVASSFHAERLLPGDFRRHVYRTAGWISPVLLVNGLILGVWQHRVVSGGVEITVEPFVKLPAWVRSAGRLEAERLGQFLDRKLVFKWNH